MRFATPIPFSEALDALLSKRILPTAEKSVVMEALARQYPKLMRNAFFSARTTDYRYLDAMRAALADLVDPAAAKASGRQPLSRADFRLAMRDALAEIGYRPADEAPSERLDDLASDKRLNLIVQMQTEMAWGRGAYVRQQTSVDAFPCLELFRAEERAEERDWPTRWQTAARVVGDLAAARVEDLHGRMIATKDSPIWAELSRFGNPYPPFDYNSGMWTREIDRAEAVALEVISPDDVVAPGDDPDAMEVMPVGDRADGQLLSSLRAALGAGYSVADGVLRRVG